MQYFLNFFSLPWLLRAQFVLRSAIMQSSKEYQSVPLSNFTINYLDLCIHSTFLQHLVDKSKWWWLKSTSLFCFLIWSVLASLQYNRHKVVTKGFIYVYIYMCVCVCWHISCYIIRWRSWKVELIRGLHNEEVTLPPWSFLCFGCFVAF